tara:strand:+ start:189 stop:638 length:450 start_codon:yes stop_codon:yes gene_type:complete
MFYQHHHFTNQLRDALDGLMAIDGPFQYAWTRVCGPTASVSVCYEDEDFARENKGKFDLFVNSRVGHIMGQDTLRFFAGFLADFVNEKMNPCEKMTPDNLRIVGGVHRGTFSLMMDGVRCGAKPDDYDRRHEDFCRKLFEKPQGGSKGE